MKKYLLVIVLLGVMLLPMRVNAKEKIKVYMFRSDSCNHCEQALDYLSNNKDALGDNIDFITFEVSKNDSNRKLLNELGEVFNLTDKQKGNVPLFVIGDQYILGYGAQTFANVVNMAEEYLDEKKDFVDVVVDTQKKLQKENGNLKFDSLTLNDLFPEPNKVVSVIVFSVFGLAILGFIGMIVFSRKN